jgi:hypothetical protein
MRTFDFARLCEGQTRPARSFRSPRVAARALLAVVLVAASAAASAVPSFARQTGQPCMTCHVGGFGPQLTDFGIGFKLNGYTMTKGGDTPIPLAGMVMTGFTHTKASQDPAALDGRTLTGGTLKANDNLTLDQVSLFYAGRIAEHLGIFSQLTYDGLAQRTSIDNVDVRAAATSDIGGGHSLLYGASVNNSPGVQDPFNTMPSWAFPYIGSNAGPRRGHRARRGLRAEGHGRGRLRHAGQHVVRRARHVPHAVHVDAEVLRHRPRRPGRGRVALAALRALRGAPELGRSGAERGHRDVQHRLPGRSRAARRGPPARHRRRCQLALPDPRG